MLNSMFPYNQIQFHLYRGESKKTFNHSTVLSPSGEIIVNTRARTKKHISPT